MKFFMVLAGVWLAAGLSLADANEGLSKLIEAGDSQELATYFATECSPEKLTEVRFAQIRKEIEFSNSTAKARLAAWEALSAARESIIWRVALVAALANAHDECGGFDAFVADLEKQAAEDANAALKLVFLYRGTLQAEEARRWAEVAVAKASLEDVDFWHAGYDALGAMRVLDADFFKRVAEDTDVSGYLRVNLLLRARGYAIFPSLFSQWMEDHPEELAEALPPLFVHARDLPFQEVVEFLDRAEPMERAEDRLLLGVLHAELQLLRLDKEGAREEMWKSFEQAGGIEDSVVFERPVLDFNPRFRPDPAEFRSQPQADYHTFRHSGGPGEDRWMRARPTVTRSVSARALQMRCLRLITYVDGDGAASAARLTASPSFIRAKIDGRVAYLGAARLHKLLPDELGRDSAGETVDQQLAALEFVADQMKYFTSAYGAIAWRMRMLDATIERATELATAKPEQALSLAAALKMTAENLRLPTYISAAIAEISGLVDPAVARAESRVEPARLPRRIPRVLDEAQRRHMAYVFRRHAEDAEKGLFVLGQSWTNQLPVWTLTNNHSEKIRKAVYGETGPHVESQPLDLWQKLLGLTDREFLESDDLVAERRKRVAEIRANFDDDPEQRAFIDLVIAQLLATKPSGDWEKIRELAGQHTEHRSPAARAVARDILALATRIGGDDEKAADEVFRTIAKSLHVPSDTNGLKPAIRRPGSVPDQKLDPLNYMLWAKQQVGRGGEFSDTELAWKILQTYSESSLTKIQIAYRDALKILEEKGELADGIAQLLKSARAGDRAAAAALVSAATGKLEGAPSQLEAAAIMCAAIPENYVGHNILLRQAIADGEDEAAFDHWRAGMAVIATNITATALYSDETSPVLVKRMCNIMLDLADDPDPRAATYLIVRAIEHESSREAGMALGRTLIREHPGTVLPLELIERLLMAEVDMEAMGPALDQIVMPELLRTLGLVESDALRQNKTRQLLLLSNVQAKVLAPAFARAGAGGLLDPHYATARRAIAAGFGSRELRLFHFYASLQVAPAESAAALAALYETKDVGRPPEEEVLLGTLIPLLPDSTERAEAFSLIAPLVEPGDELVLAGLEAAVEADDRKVIAQFIALAQRVRTPEMAPRLMHLLVADGELPFAERLYHGLGASCRVDESRLRGPVMQALTVYLDSLEGERLRVELVKLIDLVRSVEGEIEVPEQLWDLAVRRGHKNLALELAEGTTGAHGKIADLVQGDIHKEQLFARLTVNGEGSGTLTTDLATTANRGDSIWRPRFPLDGLEAPGDVSAVFDDRTLRFRERATTGQATVRKLQEDCQLMHLEINREEGGATLKGPSLPLTRAPRNLLMPQLDAGARPAAAYDPCEHVLPFTSRIDARAGASVDHFIPLSPPVPLDQIMHANFSTWLRIDAPGIASPPNNRREIEVGLMFLDSDKRFDENSIFERAWIGDVTPGGDWRFLNFSRRLQFGSDADRYREPTPWVQLVLYWQIQDRDHGDVTVTLGDPVFGTQRMKKQFKDTPALEHRLENLAARAIGTQLIRDGRTHEFGIPLATGNEVSLYLEARAEQTYELPAAPRDAFIFGTGRSLVVICEDESIWSCRRDDPPLPIGKLAAPKVAGASLIFATPSGRRLIRIINTDAGPFLEIFKVAASGIEFAFEADLRPLKLKHPLGRIVFDSHRGVMTVENRETIVKISFIKKNHEEIDKIPLEPPGVAFTWRSDPRVSGLRSRNGHPVNIRIHGPEEATFNDTGSDSHITSANAAFLNADSNEVVTIEHGWFRHWTLPELKKRRALIRR